MSPPRIPEQVVRPTTAATPLTRSLLAISLLAMSLLGTSLLPILMPAPASAATTARAVTTITARTPATQEAAPLAVSLVTITPAIAVPKAAVTITGNVRNTTGVTITSPLARALLGQSSLSSRQTVSGWATSTNDLPLEDVAHMSLGATLAPGDAAAFTLTIAASSINHGDPFAVLPLRVEVAGTTSVGAPKSGGVHTFLPTLGPIKKFEPISIAWLLPLTLDPDPALFGAASPGRTAAWTKAIGPGSRLDRLIRGTESANVTWAIDPAILGPQQTPSAVDASTTPNPTPSVAQPTAPDVTPAPDPVTGMTASLAKRLKAAAPLHTLWSLPYADPDLTALLPLTSGNQSLTTLISHPSTLDVAVGPARADIAWPVGGRLTPQTQALLRRAFASPGLTAAVTSASTLTSSAGPTADASHKASSGLPLLAYDEALSRTVAQTSSASTGAITIQRFLADSMALLGERPGTPNRSVLVAEPRTFTTDPAVLQSLFVAVANAPWLKPTTTGQLLAASEKLPAEAPVSRTGTTGTSTASPTTPTASDPVDPGTSPLTPGQLAAIPGTLSAIAGLDSILSDAHHFSSIWTDAQVQTFSTRWRNHPEGLAAVNAATRAAVSSVSGGVSVAPSSVNFFADRGVMQVTVVNNLSVPIHDVHLVLTPAQPRLRLDRQPGPLKIGAKSRATVPLHVTSIAAGVVSVKAVLTTANGTPLGQNASVNVRVQPTGTWIYWALGGLAGLILVLGTQRSLRRGSTRASRPDAQEPPLND